jgi:hypothetical protein
MSTPCPTRTQIDSAEVTPAQVQALAQRDEQLAEAICELERKFFGAPVLPGTFAFISDVGDKGAEQTAAHAALDEVGLQGIFFGGDNNLPAGAEATIEENWEIWDTEIDCGTVFPAFGNTDLDTATGQAQMDKFDIPRYYSVTFDRGDVELFVLNSGLNTGRALVEPDGNTVGSDQYNWFVQNLAASTARWKIVMFHHPFATTLDTAKYPKKRADAMQWDWEDLGVHLIVNGHIWGNEHLTHYGVDMINCSAAMNQRDLDASGAIAGGDGGTKLVWHDRSDAGLRGTPAYAKITATATLLTVEFVRIDNGNVIHSFNIA